MIANDNGLTVIGVKHLATKNNLTVRVRIYIRRFDRTVYSFDADCTIWELQKLNLKECPETLGVEGIPQ